MPADPLWTVHHRSSSMSQRVGAAPLDWGTTMGYLRRALQHATATVDRVIGWDRLPRILGLATLIGIRSTLRAHNLHDVRARPEPAPSVARGRLEPRRVRTADGSANDPNDPDMGKAGSRFGRNVPPGLVRPDPNPATTTPDPRTVSRELLTRDVFQPATTLNVLAAAWIQFEIRDWFSHAKSSKESWEIPLADGDPWPEPPMRIPRTPAESTRDSGPPTFTNTETHWWDASQLYGSSEEFQRLVRSGEAGKLRLSDDGLLPLDPTTLDELPGGLDGWWAGLALLHVLFMREHNAVCDRLRAEYPGWSDDELFEHARLVVAALIAKIHTVEWTPAILGHPTLQIAMRANWWGLAGERLNRLVGRLGDSEVVSGIPGSPTDHHGVPYSITEEFVSVYRLHPLIPDDFSFRSVAGDRPLEERTFSELTGSQASAVLQRIGLVDGLYSLGTRHPGAVTLHNYPHSLQALRKLDGSLIDLGATDILRDRERGVPRYNDFRRSLHLQPVGSFEELTANAAWAEELRRLYGDVERVDLMVGLYAEQPPKGFGFSDTAFRVFVLMASRRLKSDRFFTSDYTEQVYTKAGMDWIRDNDMRTVLARHCPQLAPVLQRTRNAFAPWPTGA